MFIYLNDEGKSWKTELCHVKWASRFLQHYSCSNIDNMIDDCVHELFRLFVKDNPKKNKYGPLTMRELTRVATHQRIKKIVSDRLLKTDGGLLFDKTTRSFNILYRPGQSKQRTLFTIAHEIGHTLFFDISKLVPDPLIPWNRLRNEYILERFCDAFAASLLVPKKDFLVYLKEIDFNISDGMTGLEKIANHYNVNIDVIIQRLGELDLLDNSETFIIKTYRDKTANRIIHSVAAPREFGTWSFIDIEDLPREIMNEKERDVISLCRFREHSSIECYGSYNLVRKNSLSIGIFSLQN